jgi:urease accessory protein
MLVESAASNLDTMVEPPDSGSVDWLDLTWIDCRTRFARRRTRDGGEVRILLRLATALRHGDVLGQWPDGRWVAVNVLATEVCVVRPATAVELATVAFEMGNLHVPIELSADRLVVPTSAAVEVALDRLGVACEVQSRRFEPTHWPDSTRLTPTFAITPVGSGSA